MDAETGYMYYGTRYYNPRASLWLNVDPLAKKFPSFSPYIYVANNPINAIDPDGRDIIFILDKEAATKKGHIAILIGNEWVGNVVKCSDINIENTHLRALKSIEKLLFLVMIAFIDTIKWVIICAKMGVQLK